jgi:hypothetical protein
MKTKKNFRYLLEKYLNVHGLDIIIKMTDGSEIELYKNRLLLNDILITMNNHSEKRIHLSQIKSVDLYAA